MQVRAPHYIVASMAENLRVECSIHSLPTKKALITEHFLTTDCGARILGARLGAIEHTSMLKFVVTLPLA